MAQKKTITEIKEKKERLADRLNQVPFEDTNQPQTQPKDTSRPLGQSEQVEKDISAEDEKKLENQKRFEETKSELFDLWESAEFEPDDFTVDVPIGSLESKVGFSSLVRQFYDSYTEMVAFCRSFAGGSLSLEEAQTRAFRQCENVEEAKEIFSEIMNYPYENISFNSMHSLWGFAPRVAERLWEKIKDEGRKEFESGHLAANTMFPVPYMKQAWNIARYLGIRESFISEWQPKGGIEVSLIDMMAQSFFQWQYWMEQVVRRSETEPRREHQEYQKWKQWKKESQNSWEEGYWFPPYVHEQDAIEHAVQMADRFNRIYLRTLRQLRDLRRYSPVTINNPNQVNIANEGGQQINISKANENNKEKLNL